MKNLKLSLMTLLAFLYLGIAGASAETIGGLEVTDVTAGTFDVKTAGIWRYTATEDGEVTLQSSGNDGPALYSPWTWGDELPSMDDPQVDFQEESTYANFKAVINLIKGQTLYMLVRFAPWDPYQLTLTAGKEATAVTSIVPAPGESLVITGGDTYVTVEFNNAGMRFDTGNIETNPDTQGGPIIASGSMSQRVEAFIQQGKWFKVPVADTVMAWLKSGDIKPGDPITVTLEDIRDNVYNAADEGTIVASACLAGSTEPIIIDGKMVLNYICPSIPVTLESVDPQAGSDLLAYYAPDDPAGLFTFVFSDDVNIPGPSYVKLWYGYSSPGITNSYYEETVPYTVEGNKVIVNLTGQVRDMRKLAPNGANPCYVELNEVTDKDGNYIFANQGQLGKVSVNYKWTLLPDVSVEAEFEPNPQINPSLDGINQVTIWVKPLERIGFDGIYFSYEKNGSAVEVPATYTVDESLMDEDGFTPVRVAIPDAVRGKGTVQVYMKNIEALGAKLTGSVRATYTSSESVMCVSADNMLPNGEINSLSKFTVTYDKGIALGDTPKTITIANASKSDPGEIVAEVVANAENISFSNEGDVQAYAHFQLAKELFEGGRFLMTIPAGTFKLNGVDNEEKAQLFIVTVGETGHVGDMLVTPNPLKSIEKLDVISIVWPDESEVYMDYNVDLPVIKDQQGNTLDNFVDVTFTDPKTMEYGEANQVFVTISDPITEPGVYTIDFPAKSFMFSEFDMEGTTEAFSLTYTIAKAVDYTLEQDRTLDPSPEQPVSSLKDITITWNKLEIVNLAGSEPVLYDAANNVAANSTVEYPEDFSITNQVIVKLEKEITEPGVYTLAFPAGCFSFMEDDDYLSQPFSIVYTIGESGIGSIAGEPDEYVKVYNLQGILLKEGRRADAVKGLKGLYIIGGKKTNIR